ncbi:DUF1385 domain-containing protein [Caldalkalibacillus thermarum TA2.A1]|uniref:DUF1385 domain-containing protein n=1 Tax=Caldalkalibacillus thermarum (strain TA2.A1) TaxID=986075 RepID=A0A8X8I6U1_CALTT|nr:DUF1385 domain-containing protein [Caldalkalibacillus thermarum]QZT32638.1 DUF1385 domain-containing protein [Caldalkalibacillus thermarum TA2.A1]
MNTETKPQYGGQAIVEGVMFAGRKAYVSAIRRKDGRIDYLEVERTEREWMKQLKKIPLIRGNVALIEAAANGSKHLNFSTERYDVDPEDDAQLANVKQSKLTMILGVAFIGVLSFALSKIIFTALPAIMAHSLFKAWFPGHIEQNLIEGMIKTLLLLGYIYLISLTPLVKRLFQYHGAEHKVINCYEQNKPLTVEHVQACSRLHYRCGSSFILFTIIIGVFLYLFVPSEPLWERILYRLALIPVVIGVSYEVLQLTNKCRNIPVLKYLGYPGLAVQLLTTKDPTDDQVEVAIASFKRLLEREQALNPMAADQVQTDQARPYVYQS